MGSAPSHESFGQLKDPKAAITIQYCGGWGYRSYAANLQKSIEANFPEVRVDFNRDSGVTGNFEVLIYPGAEYDPETSKHGESLHSKKATE